MAITRIAIHLPAHRERALQIESRSREAERAYDHNIGGYIEFLREQARLAGFDLDTDPLASGAVFSIHELNHAQKKAAHDWLEQQPDIWNWMPSAN